MTDEYVAGQVIGGRYRVIGRIGGGGMAVVYVAEDTTLGRRVAIKMLHRRFVEDAKFVERFRREAKAAAGLNHANIVGVYDWGEEAGQNYIVMEYVQGETLKDLIRRRGHLSGHSAVAIGLELLAAVGAAHANGVVHRDIKSQNILIDREGRAKVTDFGIAQGGEPGMTEAGSILGTAQYLAPEQARGEPVDERSDLYSVGVVLYEMLTGTVPFKGESSVTVALKHVNELPTEPAKLVPGLPHALNQIVLKAMAKDPNRRYGNAAEFAADLRAAEGGGPLRAATFDSAAERTQVLGAVGIPGEQPTRVLDAKPIPTRAARTAPAAKRRRTPLWVWLVSAAALIAVVVVGVLVFTGGGSTSGLPNVVGLDKQTAVHNLTTAGYKVSIKDTFSDTFATGFVTRQEPPAGTNLIAGGIVDLTVSKGPTTVTLDDLTGRTAADVAAYLKSNGLVGDPHTGRSSSVADGQVYKQDPAAGSKLSRIHHDTVQYWVSGGAPRVTVPDVTGMTAAAAAADLNQHSLKVGSSTNQSSDTVPDGEVISQDPGAGTKVDQGSTVDLVISSGATTSPSPTVTPSGTPVPVPSVVTMDLSTAESTLTAAGFGYKVKMVSDPSQAGLVTSQDPLAGDLAPTGSKVTIFVAQ